MTYNAMEVGGFGPADPRFITPMIRKNAPKRSTGFHHATGPNPMATSNGTVS